MAVESAIESLIGKGMCCRMVVEIMVVELVVEWHMKNEVQSCCRIAVELSAEWL